MHTLNLALRFLLEIAALGAVAWWGHSRTDEPWRWALAFGLPLLFAVLWGTFAVPDDPSRGGQPVVAVPGAVRLALELAVFGAGVLALRGVDRPWLALSLGALVLVHYAAWPSRIRWLLER